MVESFLLDVNTFIMHIHNGSADENRVSDRLSLIHTLRWVCICPYVCTCGYVWVCAVIHFNTSTRPRLEVGVVSRLGSSRLDGMQSEAGTVRGDGNLTRMDGSIDGGREAWDGMGFWDEWEDDG